MIFKTLADIKATDRYVFAEDWETARLLLKKDGMGFSFSITTIDAGRESPPRGYKNHLEAVFILKGEGEIECLDEDNVYPLSPGTFYALNHHDRYILRSHTQIQAVCVFNPPLCGSEIHDEEGSYPLMSEEAS